MFFEEKIMQNLLSRHTHIDAVGSADAEAGDECAPDSDATTKQLFVKMEAAAVGAAAASALVPAAPPPPSFSEFENCQSNTIFT